MGHCASMITLFAKITKVGNGVFVSLGLGSVGNKSTIMEYVLCFAGLAGISVLFVFLYVKCYLAFLYAVVGVPVPLSVYVMSHGCQRFGRNRVWEGDVGMDAFGVQRGRGELLLDTYVTSCYIYLTYSTITTL